MGNVLQNTCFAMSNPIVLTCSTDASFGGSSTPPFWHADAVGGRQPHHPKLARTAWDKAFWVGLWFGNEARDGVGEVVLLGNDGSQLAVVQSAARTGDIEAERGRAAGHRLREHNPETFTG